MKDEELNSPFVQGVTVAEPASVSSRKAAEDPSHGRKVVAIVTTLDEPRSGERLLRRYRGSLGCCE